MQVSYLARQQQALIAALFDLPDNNAIKLIATETINTTARGIKAYKTNAHMLAQGVLEAAYPVVSQLLGSESLADLACALWHAEPPDKGDLALWGDALPAFMAQSPQLQSEPYLPDVARAEWAMHQCATAPDAEAEPTSLALLTTQDPVALHLRLAPGCALVSSAWPVASILSAHLHGTPSLVEVGTQIRASVAQDVLIWRKGFRPQFREAIPAEAGLMRQLLAGASLGHALERSPGLDFAQWFPTAFSTQLVLGVQMSE
jgi:hypothetical protein